MRRFLLTLSIISISGWSQPVQIQPPIVVQVQMPPTNHWMHLAEVVLPGVVGAAVALLGVWLTNKRNSVENAANRQHALDIERLKDEIAAEAGSRDNRWELQKEVYVNLINALTDLITAYSNLQGLAEQNSTDQDKVEKCNMAVMSSVAVAVQYANLAPLAKADPVRQLVSDAIANLIVSHGNAQDELDQVGIIVESLYSLRQTLQEAGHEALWGTSEPKARVQTPTPQLS